MNVGNDNITSSLVLTFDQAWGGGGGGGGGARGGETEREEGPSDCRLFRYCFEHGRSRNIVKLLFIVYSVSCR